MSKIAISYRRSDSQDITGRIFDRLAQRYGKSTVFRDIDNIRPGIDFRAQIAVPIPQEEDWGRVSGIAWSPDGTQIGYLLNRSGVMSIPAPDALSFLRTAVSVTSAE